MWMELGADGWPVWICSSLRDDDFRSAGMDGWKEDLGSCRIGMRGLECFTVGFVSSVVLEEGIV